jgi:HlyD family secretion protein
MENKMVKKNKIVTILFTGFIVIVVICTYFSKTIKNALLPEVTIVQLNSGVIGDGFESTATVKYANTHKIYKLPTWTIKELDVKLNDDVKKGQVLAKVDNDAITLSEREEEEVIMQLEDEINSLKKQTNPDQDKIKEDQFKLETENIKYKDITKGLTSDGSILSDIDGKIVNINPELLKSTSTPADETSSESSNDGSEEDMLFEIVGSDTSFCLNWTVGDTDADKLSVGDSVNVSSEGDDDNSKFIATAIISDEKYNSDKDQYEITATIKDKVNLKEDDKVSVSLQQTVKRYNNVIPKSCLYDENGSDYIYEVNSKGGSLGEEDYVQKIQVQVVASDTLNCSIKAVNGSQIPKSTYGIVSNTSKPLDDNDEVEPIFQDVSR